MLVGGRYETIRELSRGGVGKTYLADDTYRRGGAKYVVKRLKPKVNHPLVLQAAREVFDAEVKVLLNIGRHDQIPKLVAYFEQGGEFYLVQELIDGHTLQLPLGIKLEEEEAVTLLGEILTIVLFLHRQNVIHQDITPQSFIRRRSDRKLVLVDVGAIKLIRNLGLDSQGQAQVKPNVGTPGYMPNEQIEGFPTLASDIYAIGMLGIQAVTGFLPNQLPRDPKTQEIVWHDQAQIRPGLMAVLDRMVRYRLDDRYASLVDVMEALGLPVPATETVNSPVPASPPPVAKPISAESLPPAPPPVARKPGPKKPGYIAIAPQFDLARTFSEDLAAVLVKDRLGYIDLKGKFVIPPQFDATPTGLFRKSAYEFHEGLAAVETKGRWGYVDKSGNLLIPAWFDSAARFSEGLARVEVDHQYGYISRDGQFAIPLQFESAALTFSEGLAAVEIDQRYGYIDKTGKVVIPPTFDSAERFCEGLARVTMDHKYGFINKRGQFSIFPQFDVAHSFHNGMARVRIDGRYGYINPAGEVIIPSQFDDNYNFSDGLALVRNGEKYGFIDPTGKIVIRLEFDDAFPFSEGLAAVKLGSAWGFIDKEGIFVINLQFDEAESFTRGLAVVRLDDKWGYIGK